MHTRQALRNEIIDKFGVILEASNGLVGTANDMFVITNEKGAVGPRSSNNELMAAIMFGIGYGKFIAVKILCEEGVGYGASVVLRTLLDLFIKLHWILADKTANRAEKYLFWPWKVQYDEMTASPSDYGASEKSKIEHNYRSVLQMYTYTNKQGKKMVASRWHLPDANTIRDMAKEVGLLDHYVGGYKFLSRIVHLDPSYVVNMVDVMSVIQHDPGFHKFILNEALALNFTYFLNICMKINDMFVLGKEPQLKDFAQKQKSFPRRGEV